MCGLDSTGSEQGPVAGFYENNNLYSGPVKGGADFEHLVSRESFTSTPKTNKLRKTR
jgi:hypothetical protein